MKVKKSITLSEDLLHSILMKDSANREIYPDLLRMPYRILLSHRSARRETSRILRYFNKKARKLHREAEDVLSYQTSL